MPHKTMTVEPCSLSNLKPGVCAGIICTECGKDVGLQLEELGFVPGADVEVLRGGCPLVVRVGDARFCMRREQAAGIKVEPLS